MSELLIKINADAKNAAKAFDDIKKQSEDLSTGLNRASLVGAAAFAALTAEVVLSTNAFGEAQLASTQLTLALQNQGIFTTNLRDSYRTLAEQVAIKTGLDDDQIVASQAVAQRYLGQMEVTQRLTQAIADLATEYNGNLNAAAEAIGRTIGGATNAFAKQGLTLDETMTKTERMAAVLDFIENRYGGQAEAANKANFGITGLKNAFGDFQEELGERFAPAAEGVIGGLTRMFRATKDNKVFLDLAASLVAGGIAMSGIIAIAPQVINAFVAVRAAMGAAAAQIGITTLAVRGLLITSGIGALVAAVTFLALNWEASWLRIKAITSSVGTFITEVFQGLAQAARDPFNLENLAASILRIKFAGQEAYKEYNRIVDEGEAQIQAKKKASEEKQNEDKKAAADKLAAQLRDTQAKEAARRQAEAELQILEIARIAGAELAIKKEEVALLRTIENEKNAAVRAAAEARLITLREMAAQQHAEEMERVQEFALERAALEQELTQQKIDVDAELKEKELAELQASLMTEADIDRKIQRDMLAERIRARNLDIEDRKRYGSFVATLTGALRSTEVQAAKTVGAELVGLAQSKNAALKAIGKAAAIANISIAAAESAVTIGTKVIAALPFPINIPIAAGLAAARIAFGAEQIAQVQGAQKGALVEGPGRGDTVPMMTEPGELITPRKNFEEVVEGVGRVRNNRDDEIMAALEAIQSRPVQPSLVVQGDFIGEETFVDRLIDRVSDRLQFGNARLLGVTT